MKKLFLFLSLSFIFLSCNSEKSEKKENDNTKIGKYLYLTDDSILHSELNCVGIITAKYKDGHKVTGMKFVDTLAIVYDGCVSYCTWCFNDALYEQVQGMIKRNYGQKGKGGE